MRKWGKQGFLNPADSNDDGWYKFSIRPRNSKDRLQLDIQFIIADCSNKVYLEFDPNFVRLDGNGAVVDMEEAKSTLKDIDCRIRKIRKFRDAVNQSTVKIEEALWKYRELVEDAVDQSS